MTKYKEYDTYEDLTDGEVLDIVYEILLTGKQRD